MNQFQIDTLVLKIKYRIEILESLFNESQMMENRIYYLAQKSTLESILRELEN